MASYYAQIDANGIVLQVIAVADSGIYNADGSDNEAAGIAFCQAHYGSDTKWLHTRYDGSIRKNYAGIGFSYDVGRDAFIPPQPYQSWLLNEESCQWYAPVSYPTDGKEYQWDESTVSWKEIVK